MISQSHHIEVQKMQQFFDKGGSQIYNILETLIYFQNVTKFTNSNKELERILVFTSRNIYNIAPEEENPMISFVQSIFQNSRIKRRICLNLVSGVTTSSTSGEFVIHVPSEYDQRYRAETNKLELLVQFCEVYTKCNFKKLTVHITEDFLLIPYTTTTHDLKKQIRRSLPTNVYNLSSSELKVVLQSGALTEVVFQKNPSHKPIQMDDFDLIKVLGRGAFGKVMLCKKIDTQELYAIKCLSKGQIIKNEQIEYIKTERKILEQINNPFLVSLDYCFQTKEKLYFVMKFMRSGELFTHLRKVKKFTEETTLFYAAQILLALEYLHEINIVYRDLKPENILMDEQGYIALTDYGLAKIVNKGEKTRSIVGTAEYLAPEIIQEQGHTMAVDWWSFGILIYEMLVGRTPFYSDNRNQLFRKIVEEDVTYPASVYLKFDTQNLISSLLKKNQKDRLGSRGAEEIKKHPFFKNFNFADLEHKRILPPFQPDLEQEDDLKYFNANFTAQNVTDTPYDDRMITSVMEDEFFGMSYQTILNKDEMSTSKAE